MTDHEISVKRVQSNSTGYEYEFIAYVNGEPFLTATQLENRGAKGPREGGESWIPQLKRHALSYCDGLDAAAEADRKHKLETDQ